MSVVTYCNRKHSAQYKPLWYANLYNLAGPAGLMWPPLPHSTLRLPFIQSFIRSFVLHTSWYGAVGNTAVTRPHLIVSWWISQAFLQVWETHWWLHVFKVASWWVCGENAAVEIRTSKFYHPIQLPWQSSPASDVWQIKSLLPFVVPLANEVVRFALTSFVQMHFQHTAADCPQRIRSSLSRTSAWVEHHAVAEQQTHFI